MFTPFSSYTSGGCDFNFKALEGFEAQVPPCVVTIAVFVPYIIPGIQEVFYRRGHFLRVIVSAYRPIQRFLIKTPENKGKIRKYLGYDQF